MKFLISSCGRRCHHLYPPIPSFVHSDCVYFDFICGVNCRGSLFEKRREACGLSPGRGHHKKKKKVNANFLKLFFMGHPGTSTIKWARLIAISVEMSAISTWKLLASDRVACILHLSWLTSQLDCHDSVKFMYWQLESRNKGAKCFTFRYGFENLLN